MGETMVDNLVVALSQALHESRCYPGPAVFKFLDSKGITQTHINEQGGWVPVLLGMIPEEYETLGGLVSAIKAFR